MTGNRALIIGIPEVIVLALLAGMLIVFGKSLKGIQTRGIVLTSILCAVAGASGAALRSVPGVQLTSFIIIMIGVTLGPGAGIAAGATSALLFDILSVMTIYTPWRMFLWAHMGLGAALITMVRTKGKATSADSQVAASNSKSKLKLWTLTFYGFIWGFVFGWTLNLVYIFAGLLPFTLEVFIISCVASFWFDLSHAVCNAVLILLFSQQFLRIAEKVGKLDASKVKSE